MFRENIDHEQFSQIIIVSTIRINITYLKSQLIIILKLNKKSDFLIKSIVISCVLTSSIPIHG